MNNYKTDYITEWTSNDKLPPIGISCPACNKGTIEENSFTSKKGEYFKSVLCKKCRKKWIVSKGRVGGGTEHIIKEKDQGELILKGIEGLANAIKILNENIVNIAEGLNKLLKK